MAKKNKSNKKKSKSDVSALYSYKQVVKDMAMSVCSLAKESLREDSSKLVDFESVKSYCNDAFCFVLGRPDAAFGFVSKNEKKRILNGSPDIYIYGQDTQNQKPRPHRRLRRKLKFIRKPKLHEERQPRLENDASHDRNRD